MKVELGISARHVHLTRNTIDILFGKGYELTKLKDLKQLGQFAANERVEVIGSRDSFKAVRILGPERSRDQVELSVSDCVKIGVKPIVRNSGNIEGTPGVKIIGPKGEIEIKNGVIVAARHVHVSIATAKAEGINDGDILNAFIPGIREVVFSNVLARVDESFVDELHLDTDEANAASACNGQEIELNNGKK